MRKFAVNAPYGITVLSLSNGYEVLYLHGQRLAWSDSTQFDGILVELGKNLAETLGQPLQLLTGNVPEHKDWQPSDLTHQLGWGATVSCPDMPGMQYCPYHKR